MLFKTTVMRAAVRKMLVRVRGVDGGSFVVSSKDCAVEVLRDVCAAIRDVCAATHADARVERRGG